jgi:hypothetical protein
MKRRGLKASAGTHSELRRRAHAREHLVHVAPKEAAMGPNLEEAGGSDGVQSKGGRSALLGKKGGAPLLMPLGKKRGAPRSPRLHAAAPPDATGDGEEEGSAVVCSLMRHHASLCHCRCWRRREERCCRWGRRGECSSCLAADRSSEWHLSSILVPEQWRAAELEEWRERERFWIEWTSMGERCEDKDGQAGRDIFGWRCAGSEIFLVVAAGISNRYPKLILGIGCL